VKKLLGGGYFYEGARWHDGAWWVSDLYAHHVLRVTETGQSDIVVTLETQPSGLGWMPDGSLLVVSMQDQRVLRRRPDGRLSEHAKLKDYAGFWTNDMAVDGKGRAYVSNLGFNMWIGEKPAATTIARVDPDGRAAIAADNLLFPNGLVVTPDGKTLIVAETFGNRMTAFTIREDGSLCDRRIWAQFGPPPSWASIDDMLKEEYAPDGCAVDAEGCVWVADALHNRVCRVAEGGRILQQLQTPERFGIYSCALGGSDGRSLLICAAPDFDQDRRAAKGEAVLLVETVDVPHVRP